MPAVEFKCDGGVDRRHPSKEIAMPKVQPIPSDMTAVTPQLICARAADAIEFYKKAFGAVEGNRLTGKDGKIMHALLRINGAAIMLSDENLEWKSPGPQTLKGSPVIIHLSVEDADALVARAVKAGATVTMPVEDMFWGDRYGQFQDPFGHHWSVGTHVREVSPTEMKEAMKSMPDQPPPEHRAS
jgi:PhnB protein